MMQGLEQLLFPEYRLDWFGLGPGSVNKTGALLATLIVVSWWFALRFRRWGFWLSLLISFLFGGLLLQSASRGGILAAMIGLCIIAAFGLHKAYNSFRGNKSNGNYTWRLWPQLLALVLTSGLLFYYGKHLSVGERVASGIAGQDSSANVRLEIYTSGLQMMKDAPLGWGGGRAGYAFNNWYQPLGKTGDYLSLLNSHLTWMVDYGLPFQIVYVGAWAFVLCICFPRPYTPLKVTAFAVWVTLSMAAVFSSVLTLWWLCLLPALLLMAVFAQNYRFKRWPKKRAVVGWLGLGYAGLLMLYAAAFLLPSSNRLAASPDQVVLNTGATPKMVIVQPSLGSLGGKYGHSLREYAAELGEVIIFHEGASAYTTESLVLSGEGGLENLQTVTSTRVLLFNPGIENVDPMIEALGERDATIILGDLGDWRQERIWSAVAEEHGNIHLVTVPGAAEFIPNWPKYLIERAGDISDRTSGEVAVVVHQDKAF